MMSGMDVSALELGWQLNAEGHPTYWADGLNGAGNHAQSDLVRIPAPDAVRHTVLVARSGSGKSFFLGRYVEELLRTTRARVLILDPNADFRLFDRVDAAKWSDVGYDRARRSGNMPTDASATEVESWWGTIARRRYTGRSAQQPGTTRLRLWWPDLDIEFLSQDLDAVARLEVAHCHRFVRRLADLLYLEAPVPESAGELLGHAERLFHEAASGDSSLADLLADWALTVASGARRHQQRQATREADAAVRDVSLAMGHYYFAMARQYEATGLLADAKPPLDVYQSRCTTIDLPSFDTLEARLLATSASLDLASRRARFAWEQALEQPATEDERVPTVVVVDEAHNLLPAEPRSRAAAAIRDQFRDIAAEGRKFGLFLTVATQRPDKLDPLILSECENRALMRIDGGDVLTASAARFGIAESELEACQRFPVGRVRLYGTWAPEGPIEMASAARRTMEAGRNLRSDSWARPEAAG